MKIVVNKCHGGFGVTEKVVRLLREWGWEPALKTTLVGEVWPNSKEVRDKFLDSYNFEYELRADPMLIKAIEQIGLKESSAKLAELEIVEIPDDISWEIDDYDGIETVEESHRSW